VEWLGDIPEHWEMRRLKTICSMRSGDAITAMSIEPAGDYPVYGGNGIRGYTSHYTHDGNFALIGRQGALCGTFISLMGGFGPQSMLLLHLFGQVISWNGLVLFWV